MELSQLLSRVGQVAGAVAGAVQGWQGAPGVGFYPGVPAGGIVGWDFPNSGVRPPAGYSPALYMPTAGGVATAPSYSDVERWLMGKVPALVPGGAGQFLAEGGGTPAACITPIPRAAAGMTLPSVINFPSPVRPNAHEFYFRATLGPRQLKRVALARLRSSGRRAASCRPCGTRRRRRRRPC